MNKSGLKTTTVLTAFALLAALLISSLDQQLAERIAQNEREHQARQLRALLSQVTFDNEPMLTPLTAGTTADSEPATAIFVARQAQTPVAVIIETETAAGYVGPIRLLISVTPDGSILGTSVVSHTETPGLGDLIEAGKSDWLTQFNGRSLREPDRENWKVTQDGGEFDSLTGATVTSRAVTALIAETLRQLEEQPASFLTAATEE